MSDDMMFLVYEGLGNCG